MKDKQKLTVSKTLKEFEELLSEYNFFRVHNSHLINLDYIKKYNKGHGGTVIMDDGSEIEVSVRRKDEFFKRLTD
jgi:two-component system LytT family response regulator